jgi:hypothetical protein
MFEVGWKVVGVLLWGNARGKVLTDWYAWTNERPDAAHGVGIYFA